MKFLRVKKEKKRIIHSTLIITNCLEELSRSNINVIKCSLFSLSQNYIRLWLLPHLEYGNLSTIILAVKFQQFITPIEVESLQNKYGKSSPNLFVFINQFGLTLPDGLGISIMLVGSVLLNAFILLSITVATKKSYEICCSPKTDFLLNFSIISNS